MTTGRCLLGIEEGRVTAGTAFPGNEEGTRLGEGHIVSTQQRIKARTSTVQEALLHNAATIHPHLLRIKLVSRSRNVM